MEKKQNLLEKIKEHKTEIIVTGVTLISIAGVVLVLRNWDSVKEFTATGLLRKGTEACVSLTCASTLVENNISISLPSDKIIDVNDHIRNLSAGWHASAEKLATAKEHGYNLLANQTWVMPYTKNCG